MEKMEISQFLTGYAGIMFAQVRACSVYKAAVRTGTHCAQLRGCVLLKNQEKLKSNLTLS